MLMEKGAVEKVEGAVEGFYSRLFVVPKPDGTFRPILDLSRLNKYLDPPKFKMDNLQTVRSAVFKDAWMANLDLKDAYFHILIRPGSRKYLRFRVQGVNYQFRALPFGLSLAPYVFTQVVNSVAAHLRRLGVNLITFLDDWILIAKTRAILSDQVNVTCSLLKNLGFVINREKSQLTPVQSCVYLGARIDTILQTISPSQQNSERMVQSVRQIYNSRTVTAQRVLALLGQMNFCATLITRGRLRMRPVQYWLMARWKPTTGELQDELRVDSLLQQTLTWWLESDLSSGSPLSQGEPSHMIQSDASSVGWGAVLEGGQVVSGVWNPSERMLHINLLELKALFNALKEFQHLLQGSTVLCQVDNSTVVTYIRKEGGTRSPQLCLLVWELLMWCDARQIHLLIRHIPGRMNLVSDSLSRGVTATEWSIHPQVTKAVFKTWDTPMIDLFATSQNHKLSLYYSPQPDPASVGVDSLSHSWEGLFGYAFPPCPILPMVLKKVAKEHCTIILIAPLWPARSWFSLILSLLIARPLKIPQMDKLLYQNGRFHARPEMFNYHAWLLSNCQELRRDFLRKLPRMQGSVSGTLHKQSMQESGESTLIGVMENKLIHSLPLRLN